jgi:CYTH domain-containing protein
MKVGIMEIERKYLLKDTGKSLEELVPYDLGSCKCRLIEQGYLSTSPVVRVRRDNDDYYLTYKSSGLIAREEANLPLNRESYQHLLGKADGIIITKKRYEIPISHDEHIPSGTASDTPRKRDTLTVELDVFEGMYEGLVIAEVEFDTLEEANAFIPPAWFGRDVSNDPAYHNSNMSKAGGSNGN